MVNIKSKAMLKKARKAIDSLEFDVAIQICREVLEKDENNYMGLVLLGASLQNDKAAASTFEKAISINRIEPLAYRGLVKFYKNGQTERLLELYYRMSKLPSFDREKIYHDMCSEALKINDNDTLTNVFLQLYASETDPVEKKMLVHFLIRVQMYMKKKLLPLLNIILDEFGLDHAVKCFMEFEHDFVEIKEWICEEFVKRFITILDTKIDYGIYECIVKNIQTKKDNSISVQRARIIIELLKRKSSIAYKLSENMLKNMKTTSSSLILYAFSCIESGRYITANKFLMPYIDNKSMSISYRRLLLRAKCMQDNENEAVIGISYEKELGAACLGEDDYVALFHANIRLKKFDEAERCLNNIIASSSSHKLLEGILLNAKGKSDEALEILANNKQDHRCQLQMAKIYMEIKDYAKAFKLLRNAVKCGTDNYAIYLLLGHIFNLSMKNYENSQSCYLKAFELNPDCSEVGKHLSKMFIVLKKWKCNELLLTSLLNNDAMAMDKESSWPLLYLGLHYIKLEEWSSAVLNLWNYIKLNPADADAWETLGEAYHGRNSLLSAMHSYEKAIELDPARKNCHTQMGRIHCELGNFDNALKSYNNICVKEYLPAIYGSVEVKIKIANKLLIENEFQVCRDKIQEIIDSISVVLRTHKDIELWKIIYDAILMTLKLPLEYNWISFDADILQCGENPCPKVYKNESMFDLAISCLNKMNQLTNKSVYSISHEMANIYQTYYEYTDNSKYAEISYEMVIKCLSIEKNEWHTWNLLGVVCMSKPIKKYNIAQHAFIKALQLDHNNHYVWSNLGALYIMFKDYSLANQCFTNAQRLNPKYIQSCVGQALVAELNGQEATYLFGQATQLGFHKESCLGYTHGIMSNLIKSDDYLDENENKLKKAKTLMLVYNQYDVKSSFNWNNYGILLEKMGDLNNAITAYECAVRYCDADKRDLVLLNIARVYGKQCKYEEGIAILKTVQNITLEHQLLLGLYYCKNNNIKESFEIYNNISKRKGNNINFKNEILISMADILHTWDNLEYAKILLLQGQKTKWKNWTIPNQTLIPYIALCLLDNKRVDAENGLKRLTIPLDITFEETIKIFILLMYTDSIPTKRTDTTYPDTLIRQISWGMYIENNFEQDESSNDTDGDWYNLKLLCMCYLFKNNYIESEEYARMIVRAKPHDVESRVLLIWSIVARKKMIDKTWLKSNLDQLLNESDLSEPLREQLTDLYKFI